MNLQDLKRAAKGIPGPGYQKLALAVIARAILDAAGETAGADSSGSQPRGSPAYRKRRRKVMRKALRWVTTDHDHDLPGTYGWWCSVASVNAAEITRALTDHLEEQQP